MFFVKCYLVKVPVKTINMVENQEYRDGQGQERDKSVQEDINENVKGHADEGQITGKEIREVSNRDLGQFGKESTGLSENNQGNWSGDYKVDTSAQGSVMPEQNNTIDESEKPETKVPPSFIGADSKTGTPQNDTNPSKSYHGNPVTTEPDKYNPLSNTADEGIHAENVGGTSEEG
jgi:hypothetical protein